MKDADEARRRWLKERQVYDEFGKLIADRVKTAIRELGIWCETRSRAKEPHTVTYGMHFTLMLVSKTSRFTI